MRSGFLDFGLVAFTLFSVAAASVIGAQRSTDGTAPTNVSANVAPGCTIHLADRYNPDDPGVTLNCEDRKHGAEPIISTENRADDGSESSVVVIHF